MNYKRILKHTWALKGPLITLGSMLAFLPLALSESSETKCAYGLTVMAIMWLTEAIPISATALVPLFLFPMTGLLKASEVSVAYINASSMLFLGGLILAVAVEETGLHKRTALAVLRIVGSDPKFVMLGVMLPCWFLSMWLSNTAASSMMIPIANAVLQQMGDVRKKFGHDQSRASRKPGRSRNNNAGLSDNKIGAIVQRNDAQRNTNAVGDEDAQEGPPPPAVESAGDNGPQTMQMKRIAAQNNTQNNNQETAGPSRRAVKDIEKGAGRKKVEEDEEEEPEDVEHKLMCKGITLCVAYACNIGGIATLIGTPPNMVFIGQADIFFNQRYKELGLPQKGAEVSFANWLLFALPMSAIILLLSWVCMMVLYIRKNMFKRISQEQKDAVKAVLDAEMEGLGPISMAELEVVVLFVLFVIMLVSRDPKVVSGWSVFFKPGYVADASSAMIIALALFVLPRKKPKVFCWNTEERSSGKLYVPLLSWEQAHRKVPWGVLILLGGGFALANACKTSGLSAMFAAKLDTLSSLDPWVLNLICTILVAAATEVTSNAATATLLMPVMYDMALNAEVNPLYLMTCAAIATSFAYMFPVATPPNAIVFSYGQLKVSDMAYAGFFMNIISVFVLSVAANSWGSVMGFDSVPEIYQSLFKNKTKSP